ncbi:MAG TPA: hypothetical protein VIH57_07535 [Bacteroidales bacterium]
MQKNGILTFILVFAFVVLGFSVNAQQDCSSKLDKARELFSSGQIEEIPSLLESCLESGLTKEEKIQATILLIQVYLFDSDREKAEQYMVFFLQNFPEYEVKPSDPAEFKELYKSFELKPVWGIGVIAGSNLPIVSVTQHYSTENLNKLNSKYSPNGIGFDAGLYINKYILPNLWISLNMRYSMINFKRKDMMADQEELNYSEKSGWISAPFSINFSLGTSRLSPYLFAGADFGYLISDKSYILKRNLVDKTIPNVVQKSTDIRRNREALGISALGGLGLQYKAMGGYFNISLGFSYYLTPYVKSGTRYSDTNRLYYYQYIDDDFKVHRLSFALGYTKIFYRFMKKKTESNETN